MTARNWAYLTLGYPIFFQGIMVLLTRVTGYSFMDSYFLAHGAFIFLLYLCAWFLFLVFVRSIIISPWDRLFSSWIVFYHLFVGLNLWPELLARINGLMGGFISKAHFGMVAHYTGIVVLFFLVWGLHAISRRGES